MNSDIVLLGAGGHAKVVIEILRCTENNVSYCIGSSDANDECLGVPVLKGDYWLKKLHEKGYCRAFIGVGSNQLRLKLASLALKIGYEIVNAISPAAVISPTAIIGRGVAVMAGVVINAETEIGDLSIINTSAVIDHDCLIGKGVHVAPQSALAGKVFVGEGSFLGIGCRIIPGISVGKWSIIGAGAVVTENISANVTAVGVPAKVLD